MTLRSYPIPLVVFLASTLAVSAQTAGPLSHPSVRVTARVDPAVVSKLAGTHPAVLARARIGSRLPSGMQLEHMILVLKSSDDQEAALHALLDAQQDKGSASYHQWLTPDSFNASFGVASADIAKVSAWLSDSGLSVESVARSGRFIVFSGSVGSIESAFNTEMHNVTVDGEAHISNTTDVSIPAALAPVVKAVKSLNDFFPRASAHGSRKVALKKNASGGYDSVDPDYTSGSGVHYVTPGDLATIFNATPLTSAGNTGQGVTISVLARSNIELADVEAFRSLFGLPKNDPNIIVVGTDPGENGDDVEGFLDAEMAGSLATGATVDFLVSSVSGVSAGIDTAGLYAVDNNIGDIITLSYSGCEGANGASGTAFWNYLWEQAAAQGQTVFVSSGDSGAAGCDSSGSSYATQGYAVNALGSSAYNVAVGGSMFVDFGPAQYWGGPNTSIPYVNALSYIPEAPWNQGRLTTTYLNSASTAAAAGSGIPSAGGGISIYTPRPSWQTGSGIPTNADAIDVYSGTGIASGSPIIGLHRLVPDLSFVAAGGHDGTLFCYEGSCYQNGSGGLSSAGVVGGTSVATPSMASVQALIDAANGGRQGNANYYYYALANQQYTASTTACQAQIGTAASSAVTLPASTCNFHDVVAGSNIVPTAATGSAGIGFSAAPGFDEASGLGSVNIANVAANWKSVVFHATTTTLSLDPTSIIHGANQAALIQVSAVSGGGTPAGDVSIIASTESGYGTPQLFTLSGGSAEGTVTGLPAGTYNVYAHYAGDGTYAASDSNPVQVVITKEGSTTAIAPYLVTAAGNEFYENSFAYGSGEIYLYTVVSANSGNGIASGAVTYTVTDNGAPLAGLTNNLDTYGTTYLLSGPSFSSFYLVADYPTLSPGSYTVKASYAGDASFNSSSGTTAFTVTKAIPMVSFTTSTAQIASGATAATLNFSIATPAAASPASGTVVFTDTTTGATLGSYSLSNGAVSFSTNAITTIGPHSIQAVYGGDGNYSGATVSGVTISVNTLATTATTLASDTTAPFVGTTVTLTATVTPVPTTSALVYFYDSGQLLGSATASISTGKAALAVTSFTAGLHSLTAKFAGNSTQSASTGSYSLTVARNVISLLISGGETSAYGQTVSFNGWMARNPTTSSAPAVVPTNVVSFYDGGTVGTLIGSAAPVFGPGAGNYVATLNISTLSVGRHNIVAFYPGDANYTSSTSVAAPLTVGKGNPAVTVPTAAAGYGSPFATLAASIAYPGPASPTGGLTFTVDNGTPVAAACSGSNSPLTCTASYPSSALSVGNHTITATEAADANYNAASGTGTLAVTVAGTVQLSVSSTQSAQPDGSYLVTVMVTNSGSGAAQNVVLTGVSVGSVSGSPLPQSLGTLRPGNSVMATVAVPASAGAAGTMVMERISGAYTGGSFGSSLRVLLP